MSTAPTLMQVNGWPRPSTLKAYSSFAEPTYWLPELRLQGGSRSCDNIMQSGASMKLA
jgi:hypothetical protein